MQITRVLSLLAVVLAFTSSALAEPVAGGDLQWRSRDAAGTDRFIVMHEENEGWVVDRFVRPRGKLQDLEGSATFATREEALASIEKPLQSKGFKPYELSDSKLSLAIEPKTEIKGKVLWQATEEWSWDWELKYAQWVTDNVDKSFFVKHQIRTDCADVAFALKWIFARIHGLPMGNQLAGSSDLITHLTMKESWSSLSTASDWFADKRFMAALNYMLSNTYTKSLLKDSYPIRIAPDTMIPGVHHLDLSPGRHHTRYLRLLALDPGQPLVLMWSDSPRIIREMYQGGFWDSKQPLEGEGGLLRIRWLVKKGSGWKLKPAEEMPDFSKEQFEPAFMNGQSYFSSAVIQRVSPNTDPLSRFDAGLTYVTDQINIRKQVVEDGFAFCQANSCSEGSANYENWSTPTRDIRINETMRQLEDLVYYNEWQYPDLRTRWNTALATPVLSLDGGVTFHTFGEIRQVWASQLYSSDPRQPIAVRWGF